MSPEDYAAYKHVWGRFDVSGGRGISPDQLQDLMETLTQEGHVLGKMQRSSWDEAVRMEFARRIMAGQMGTSVDKLFSNPNAKLKFTTVLLVRHWRRSRAPTKRFFYVCFCFVCRVL